jgi:hypothetical protein
LLLEFLQNTNALDVRIRNADIHKHMAGCSVAGAECDVERTAALKIALEKTRHDPNNPYRYASDLIAELVTVVNATEVERRDHTIDIADMIATKLGLPFSNQLLGAGAITSLRKALLTPAELGNFKATIDLSDRRCAECGRRFLNREVVTFDDSGGKASIFCTACLTPVSCPCSSCDGTATLTQATQRKLTGGIACKTCKDKKKQEQVAAFEELPDQEVNNEIVPIVAATDIPNWPPNITGAPDLLPRTGRRRDFTWNIPEQVTTATVGQQQHLPAHLRGGPNDEPR